MSYYQNLELAEQAGVTRRTVQNWIEQTRQGRLSLELQRDRGSDYIAKTPKNQLIIKNLVEERRKFLNKNTLKAATPKPEFYEIFSEGQILHIISSIDRFRDIPLQYNYFDGGAGLWDRYTQRHYNDDAPNALTHTINLLDYEKDRIDGLLAKHDKINIIDIGPGNALPVKKLLAHLLDSEKLGRYVLIDISREMLTIAERNVKEWFGDAVTVEGHVRDISREWLDDILIRRQAKDTENSINLVLLLGGTLANFRTPETTLMIVCESMGREDLLVYSKKLDSATTREQFDFRITPQESEPLLPQHRLVFDLLGIEKSHYEMEMGFDSKERARYARVRLKYALTIEFKLSSGAQSVNLRKDDTLTLWHAKHGDAFDVTNQLYSCGFNPLLTSQTDDHDYILVLADLCKD